MICADFHFGENGISFTVKGHSGRAKAGEDILCAAVSSAVYMAANTVTEILGLSPEIAERDGFLSLTLTSSAEAKAASPVIEGLCLHLAGLEEQYPDYIHVERGAL